MLHMDNLNDIITLLMLAPLMGVIIYLYYDLFTYDWNNLFESCAFKDERLLLEYNKKCHDTPRSNFTANASASNAGQRTTNGSGSTSKESGAP